MLVILQGIVQFDFFSVTDHAEFLTRREWKETIESLRNCSKISQEHDETEIILMVGWEWTQTSLDPENHMAIRMSF